MRYQLFHCRLKNGLAQPDHLKISDDEIIKASLSSEILGDTGISGLTLDFNSGVRLKIPAGNWRVVISDAETGMVFFDDEISDTVLISAEKFYIVWQIEIYNEGSMVFTHTLDLTGQEVYVECLSQLGDALCMLPYIREFQRVRGCRVVCGITPALSDFAHRYYPEIIQGAPTENTYASYAFITWMDMNQPLGSPVDCKLLPIEHIGSTLLGINVRPPKRALRPTSPRKISDPYACISVQASDPRKAWLYPGGWEIVVTYLKNMGYRVLCIDRDWGTEGRGLRVTMPEGAEDFTGDVPICDRLDMIAYADFFIGLSSGLSWVAYFAGCPVVLIAGFTTDWADFYTPYRVANRFVCNGCWSDVRVSYHLTGCPYHKGTERQWECQKNIHPAQVISAIDRLIADKNLKGKV